MSGRLAEQGQGGESKGSGGVCECVHVTMEVSARSKSKSQGGAHRKCI